MCRYKSVSGSAYPAYKLSQQMDISLSDIKLVSMRGYKSQWKIFPEDVVEVEGQPFIRLKTFSAGLMHLVFEDNDLAPSSPNVSLRGCSLSGCCGLNHIVDMRNKAKAEVDRKNNKAKEAADKPKSNLFADDDDVASSLGSMRRSRVQIKEKRKSPSTMTINVCVDGGLQQVDVLEPVHPHDSLFVKYDAATIGFVLKYMRDEGFTQQRKHTRLPAGISKNGDQFVGCHKVDGGKKKYKVSTELEDVISWKAQMSSQDHDDGQQHDYFEVCGAE